jgi:hypothetical protein
MEELVFIQTNLRMLESMGPDDAIQKSNLDEIGITKAPYLPSWLEIEDRYFSCTKKKLSHLNVCHNNMGLRV